MHEGPYPGRATWHKTQAVSIWVGVGGEHADPPPDPATWVWLHSTAAAETALVWYRVQRLSVPRRVAREIEAWIDQHPWHAPKVFERR